jgi:hypothetical protein
VAVPIQGEPAPTSDSGSQPAKADEKTEAKLRDEQRLREVRLLAEEAKKQSQVAKH